MKEYMKNRVHGLYWNDDINCARAAIICLSELFEITIEQQTIWSAVGLHGAGGYRAQCGLVEGTLMFMGIYLHRKRVPISVNLPVRAMACRTDFACWE